MSIRKKIFLGCTVLAFILFLAGVAIVFEMQRIRSSVSGAVSGNVKSMNVAHDMQRLIYNQNILVFDYISTKSDSTLNALNGDIKSYEKAFAEAKSKISIKGEKKIIESLENSYSEYKKLIDRVVKLAAKADKGYMYSQYYPQIHDEYKKVSSLIDKLFQINQKPVEGNSLLMNDNYYRMIMPAVIAIVACIILIFLFNYFISIYFLSPLSKIIKGLNAFTETRVPYNIDIKSNDEMSLLNNELKKLTELTKKHEREN